MSHTFKDGAAVDYIEWDNDGASMSVGDEIESMEISMEPGHMAMIPFVKINFKDGGTGMVPVGAVFVRLKEAKDG